MLGQAPMLVMLLREVAVAFLDRRRGLLKGPDLLSRLTLSNSHAHRVLATQCEGAYETRLEPPPTPVTACPYVAGNVGTTFAPAHAS